MKRVLLAAAAVIVMLAAAGLVALLLTRPKGAAPAPRPEAAPAAAAQVPSEAGGKLPYGGSDADHGPEIVREMKSETEVPLPATLGAAIAEGALGYLAGAAAVERAIADARAGRIDAVDLGLKLDGALAERPALGQAVLDELLRETKPEVALKLAQALAAVLDDPALRKAAVDGLRAATPDVRAVGMIALLGRGEPEVLDLASSAFREDRPDARATAGFLLNLVPGGLPESAAGPVRDAARAALAGREAPARLREESLGLLGRPGASEADMGLMERALADGGADPAVRARALAALVATGATRARLRPTLDRVLADPAAPDLLKEAVRAYLATHAPQER